jgi:hypothetical protein
MASASNAAETEFDSEAILSHRFNKETLQTEFKVKWCNCEKTTWEPIDCVYMCPKFIIDMVAKKQAEAARSLKDRDLSPELLAKQPKFPILDTSKLNDPLEFIPDGNEDVHWIIDERISEKGTLLWKVLFKGALKEPRFVRKSVVSYYWPLAASMFLTEWVHKKARRDQRLRDLEKRKT